MSIILNYNDEHNCFISLTINGKEASEWCGFTELTTNINYLNDAIKYLEERKNYLVAEQEGFKKGLNNNQ